MIKFTLLLASLIVISLHDFNTSREAESAKVANTFDWTDSVFDIGDNMCVFVRIPLQAFIVNFPKENKVLLDSMGNFLKRNTRIKIEIANHRGVFGGSEEYVKDFSQRIADLLKEGVVARGISKDRIEAIGYGSKSPIVSGAALDTIMDFHVKLRIDAQNHRTEIIIRGI